MYDSLVYTSDVIPLYSKYIIFNNVLLTKSAKVLGQLH